MPRSGSPGWASFGQHFEQQHVVAARLARHRAGVRMDFARTTPESLAQAICDHVDGEVDRPPVRADGAARAAALMAGVLSGR